MVLALLAGRKTQTRRIIKDTDVRDHHAFAVAAYVTSRPVVEGGRIIGHREVTVPARWQAGDRLWGRETFVYREKHDRYYYRADHPKYDPYAHNGWRPSIFMPRKACRLLHEVTAVRVERLQDISRDDAIAEGLERRAGSPNWFWPGGPEGFGDPRACYLRGWDTVNGKGSAASNPHVWVVSFKAVTK